MKKAEIKSYLTHEEIIGVLSKKTNPLVYPNGSPVSTESQVVKLKNNRYAVIEPNGELTPLIRKSSLSILRHVFYNGHDVPDTLTVHNPRAHKYHSSYVIIDGVRIPVFTKAALAKGVLSDEETNERILPDTAITLVGNNEIRTLESDRPLYHEKVSNKSTIPGFENLFPMSGPRYKKRKLNLPTTSSVDDENTPLIITEAPLDEKDDDTAPIFFENSSSKTTPPQIQTQDRSVKSAFVYSDGRPVPSTYEVVKLRSNRHAIKEPNGEYTVVILKNNYYTARHVFYNGHDVPDTLEIHNPRPNKHIKSFVIFKGVRIPVFTKAALAKCVLQDAETKEDILPYTPIKLTDSHEIRTIETDRPLSHLRATSKSKRPGFENIFPHSSTIRKNQTFDLNNLITRKRPAEEITLDTKACSDLEDDTTTLPSISSSSTLNTSENTRTFDDEFIFDEKDLTDDEDDLMQTCKSSQEQGNPYPLVFFERTGVNTPPPTIQDLSNTEIFTPGAEGSEFLTNELKSI